MFDLVIFDCDGVLIDSEAISCRMLVRALADFGVAVELDYVVGNFLGRSYPVVMRTIEREFGVVLPQGFEAEYRARLLAAFDAELTAMPGIEAVLDGLGVPFCLATSSSPPRLERSLAITGLAGRFAGLCTTASEVTNGKPAPDLFLLAAAKAGMAPARCLVIEDSPAGVRAGLAAGMTVWRFVGGSHLRGLPIRNDPDAVAHRVIEDFGEFFDGAPDLRGKAGVGRAG